MDSRQNTMNSASKEGPDKGWSWVIAFAASFNSLVLAGIFRTSGVLFVAFIGEFGVTREEASWPVVLCISVLNLTGIVTGPLGMRFGVRPVVIVGSLVATLGLSSCYFTTSLSSITLLFGIVFGIGYGLVSNLMPIIVNEYFFKHRATANGIANSGSCIGSLILPPLFEYFIGIYGLSGCFLLTGGIVLHIAITGCLMRPPPWLQKPKKVETLTIFTTDDIMPETLNSFSEPRGYDAVIKSIERRNSHRNFSNGCENSYYSSAKKIEDNEKYADSYNKNDKRSDIVGNVSHRLTTELSDMSAEKGPIRIPILEKSDTIEKENERDSVELCRSIKDLKQSLGDFQRVCEISIQRSMEHKSFDFSNISITNKSQFKSINSVYSNGKILHSPASSINKYSTLRKNTENEINLEADEDHQLPEDTMENQDSIAYQTPSFREAHANEYCISNKVFADDHKDQRTNETEHRNESSCERNQTISSKLPVNIQNSFRCVLTCPMFYVTAITNVSFYFLFHMYVVIIIDFSLDRGVPDKDTKYVLYAFALSDLMGRLCFGWITDRHFLRRSHFVMGCMTLIGITFFCFTLESSFIWLLIVSSCYGLLLGCTMIIFPVLLVDYVGMEMQAVAYGCMCFLNGLVSLTRPFLIGYFRDNIGSYANIFFVLGGISLASSLLWLLENCFVKNQNTNVQK